MTGGYGHSNKCVNHLKLSQFKGDRKGNSEKYTPVLFFALKPCKQLAENCVFLPAQITKNVHGMANFRTTETVQKVGPRIPRRKLLV